MKQYVIVLSLIGAAAAALFWKQVLAIFIGMTVLESLEMIVQFVLHVAVATVIAYGVMTLPEFIKPYWKLFRWKQRAARRGARRQVIHEAAPRTKQPRLTVQQLLSVLAPERTIHKEPTQPPAQDDISLRF